MATQINSVDYGSGGISIKAAGLIAATTAGAGVLIGRGTFLNRIAWTALDLGAADALYVIQFQYNTIAAPATWIDGPSIALGKGSKMSGAADSAATGEQYVGLINSYDNQVRIKTWVSGTIGTGINMTVDAYAVPVVSAF